MKNKAIILIALFGALSFRAFACEICGCGNGTFYMGLLPQFTHGFIETRYNHFSFQSKIAGDATQFSNTTYQTIEVWGGYNITKKWQVIGTLPYKINKEISDDGTKDIKGFGDISILSNYQVFEKKNVTDKKAIGHQIWLGGGIKLPTGDSHVDLNDSDNNVGTFNSKLGTGSVDFILNAMYKFSYNDVGLVASTQYKINGKNSNDFKFGNRFYANVFGFYRIKATNMLKIAPNAGILYENSEFNYLHHDKVASSGGYMTSASLGLEFTIHKMGIGYNVQLPVTQNFANNQTTANTRHGIHVSFVL